MINRRQFIKVTAASTAAASLATRFAGAEDAKTTPSGEKTRPIVVVVHGKDIPKMLAAGIARLGGWTQFVKKDQKVTLKPNIAWISKPEQGADTCPVLVAECVKACKAAGASEVVVPEKTCNDWKQTFSSSGVLDAVTKAGGRMYALTEDKHFRKVDVPKGKILKQTEVAIDVLETGCLVNMPVAKHHTAAVLTMGMKNWMGSAKERQTWHGKGLHQCIVDFCTVVKPAITIMDCTRIMLTNGPRGPGEMAYPDELVLGTDPVAVDAYGATLFKKEPLSIDYIRIAHETGLGTGDLKEVDVVRLEV